MAISCQIFRGFFQNQFCFQTTGIIDPDCGFEVESCDRQEWKPEYTELRCNGEVQPMDLFYCRLESASCQVCAKYISTVSTVLNIPLSTSPSRVLSTVLSTLIYRTIQPLPPGLAKGATSPWTCIPDVYSELSDPGTSLNDCDCNCGKARSISSVLPP